MAKEAEEGSGIDKGRIAWPLGSTGTAKWGFASAFPISIFFFPAAGPKKAYDPSKKVYSQTHHGRFSCIYQCDCLDV